MVPRLCLKDLLLDPLLKPIGEPPQETRYRRRQLLSLLPLTPQVVNFLLVLFLKVFSHVQTFL